MQRVKVMPMERWREGAGAGRWVWAGSQGAALASHPLGTRGASCLTTMRPGFLTSKTGIENITDVMGSFWEINRRKQRTVPAASRTFLFFSAQHSSHQTSRFSK